MSKHLTYRDNKGQIQPSVRLQKIKVNVNKQLRFVALNGPKTELVESRTFDILPQEQGRYNLEWLEDYIKREHKLIVIETSRPLKGETEDDIIEIDILAREPWFKHEKDELGLE